MATHTVKVSIREHTQQPRLQLQRHIANFVQKQSAALGLFKASTPLCLRAGEGAALMAKQL